MGSPEEASPSSHSPTPVSTALLVSAAVPCDNPCGSRLGDDSCHARGGSLGSSRVRAPGGREWPELGMARSFLGTGKRAWGNVHPENTRGGRERPLSTHNRDTRCDPPRLPGAPRQRSLLIQAALLSDKKEPSTPTSKCRTAQDDRTAATE